MSKVKLGIIGVGNMGSSHTNNILEGKCPDIEITAIADIKQDRRDWAKEHIEGVAIFDNAMEMLDSGLIEAVLIAVPHYDHPKYAMEAFKRNIHVMCEKPAGVYTKQVVEMNEASKESDVVFGMMFNQRTNPVYKKMKEIVDSGKYGEIRRVNWIITTWFRTQYYYNSGGWRATWAGEGGGVLLNQCPHQLDLLQWICGMPCKVLSKLHYGKWHDIEVEDDVTAYLEYPNGATGVFITTTGDAAGTNRFEIQLNGAKLVIDNNVLTVHELECGTQEAIDTFESGFKPPKTTLITPEMPTEQVFDHPAVLNAWANKINGTGELIADGAEGINGLTLSNAMHLSSFLNKEIELPFDENLFYEELMKRVKNSKTKEVTENKVEDLTNTYK